ncbi:MAG: hydrogenase nickel incorporation protein HypB [Proteobacteria bacterium]|nr:hydrogenase nickel incorporation protein HypB [Pseudomonadota bacterium]MBU1688752.1 hydrogenase nickel incorporation protein HypB [Pseudomonadota bacterium]
MCDSCGCPKTDTVTIRKPGSANTTTDHHHDHHHDHQSRTIRIEQDVLGKNDQVAQRNREYFRSHSIEVFNLVSSPGSGKTTILEKTLVTMPEIPLAVIEGDQQTMHDADRIAATGAQVIQVNTGTGCHLDADMIDRALPELELSDHSILFIENVGNLVCPAMFDLGEACKIVIISVTEGDDKPLKYPTMFRAADLCLINKIDLLPYVNFDVERCRDYAKRINHHLEFIELSATSGQGMSTWLDWLRQRAVRP